MVDDINSGACLPDNECFIQTRALHQNVDTMLNISCTGIL